MLMDNTYFITYMNNDYSIVSSYCVFNKHSEFLIVRWVKDPHRQGLSYINVVVRSLS